MKIERYIYNPIFFPNPRIAWEAEGTFNPGVVKVGKKVYMLYRALSYPIKTNVGILKVSSIGLAESKDGINFNNRRFFFGPEYDYEAYGCEDPRITKIQGKIFHLLHCRIKMASNKRGCEGWACNNRRFQ